jgi:two-component system chemotaxis response regulator CheB
MAGHRVIVMGASAGGVEALRAVVANLPPDLPAPVLVVLHVPRTAPSALPRILARSGPLPAAHAVDGESLEPGRLYVAPNDHHLLVLDGRARLSRGPTENGHRPAVDPLFRSAARSYGPAVIAVVLSGSRDDGAAGMAAVARAGGTTVIQDPDDTLYPWMPLACAEHAVLDHVAPATKLGPLLADLAGLPVATVPPADDLLLSAEVEMAGLSPLTTNQLTSQAAGLGCPSCGGALWEIEANPVPRFRCRVGHAWSPQSLLEEQAIAMEGALWTALRALEEKSALSRRMARRASGANHTELRRRYETSATEAEHAGNVIRRLISRVGTTGEEDAVAS